MDLQDKISLGAAMFATPAIDRGATTMLAEVASDATDGEVAVNLPDEEGTVQVVTVPCNGDIREGDMATLIVEDGRITAISASGEGERSKAETEAAQGAADAAQSTADTAQADATQAKTDAADAKETAAGAETAAGEAKDAADTAKSAADAAKDAADTAQSAADAAGTTASEASGKADAAQSTADAAQSAADTASGKADAAQSAADAAQTSADAAKDAADAAQADATQAKTDAASASTAAASAQALAEEANATATATGQYFFTDDSGAHVTTDEGKAAGTHNLLANSEGVFVREGENPLTGMTASGFSIYDGAGSADENVVATIGATGADFNKSAFTLKTSIWTTNGVRTKWNSLSMDMPAVDSSQTAEFSMYAEMPLTIRMLGSKVDVTEKCKVAFFDCSATCSTNDSEKHYTLRTRVGNSPCDFMSKSGDSFTASHELELCGKSVSVNGTNIMLLAYPVGSIYMSVSSTSPADLFGGTWEEIAGGRVLMGQNSTYAAGSTGGAATHTHTGPAHTHTMAHTHTGPSHTHQYGFAYVCHYGAMLAYNTDGSYRILNNGTWENTPTRSSSASVGNNAPVMAATGRTTASVARVAARANTTSSGTGNTGAASNATTSSSGTGNTGSASSLMPYLAVYMWKRTA